MTFNCDMNNSPEQFATVNGYNRYLYFAKELVSQNTDICNLWKGSLLTSLLTITVQKSPLHHGIVKKIVYIILYMYECKETIIFFYLESEDKYTINGGIV